MFAHASARENESIAKTRDLQRRGVTNALASVQASLRASGEVRLKRYANNELRVSFPRQVPPSSPQGSEAGAVACFEAAEAALVYNGKVQLFGFEGSGVRKRRRPMKLTRYAAHSVREACSIIEAEFGKDSYFVTLTLPGSTDRALTTAAEHASDMLNAYMQRLRVAVGSLQNELFACGVWEYQKRGALHFHLLIGMKDKALVQKLEDNHQRWWRKVLLHYSKKTGVDLFERKSGGTWRNYKDKPRTEIAKVRKSVSRYMSKYLAKSARQIAAEGWAPPAAWHYISDPVWEQVKQERQMNALHFISHHAAEAAAVEIVEVAQAFGAKVFPTKNPFTEQTCGFVLFFDNENKDAAWNEMNMALEGFRVAPEAFKWRGSPNAPAYTESTPDYEFAEFIFEGMPLDVVAAGCADLCAPFSFQEKGGGMRYH